MPGVSHSLQNWGSTTCLIGRTNGERFSLFCKKTVNSFHGVGTYLVLLRVLLSCVPCVLCGRNPWARSVTYLIHTCCRFLSVARRLTGNLLWSIIVAVHHSLHFGEGHAAISSTYHSFIMKGMNCERNIPQHPRCDIIDVHRIYEVRPFILS